MWSMCCDSRQCRGEHYFKVLFAPFKRTQRQKKRKENKRWGGTTKPESTGQMWVVRLPQDSLRQKPSLTQFLKKSRHFIEFKE